MAKAHTKLQSMNVDALLQLREDVGRALSQKGQELQRQLQRLGGLTRASGSHPRKGLKVAPKYRGPNGEPGPAEAPCRNGLRHLRRRATSPKSS